MKKNYQPYRKSGFFVFAAISLLSLVIVLLLLAQKLYKANAAYAAVFEKNLELEKEIKAQKGENQDLQEEIAELSTKTALAGLAVKGTQLSDQQGSPLVLRGLSSHGIAWYPEYTNYRSLKTWKDYGANVFRVAMYVEQNDGYLEEPELNKKLMYSAIENSLAAGLYTIVDWHVLRDEDPNRHIDEALALFEEIAAHYGDEPGIIYEICNEPNGKTTYKDIKNYANQVIPVIRKYAPDAVILVGTPRFCTTLSEAIEDPIDYPNIMYTYHYYAGVSDCKFAMKEISEALEQGLPVFVSEWGLDSYEVTEEHLTETKNFLDFLKQKQISWVNWSLCNKDEGYSLIAPDINKLYGWEQHELTDTGRFVLQYLSLETD